MEPAKKQTDREGFVVNGRYYIYFGPTPVLLRLPFAAAVRGSPKAGFVSVFLAAALGLWAGCAWPRTSPANGTGGRSRCAP